MHLEGRTDIAAPRERVWTTLTDPRQVAPCLPGQPHIDVVDDRHLRATVRVGGGFFRTSVVIDVELSQLQPPARATAIATGSAMGGSANATTRVVLDALPEGGTDVSWSAELTLTGMLGRFESMVEGPAQSGIDQVLACLKARLEEAESGTAA